uniref:Uncharacterized protein n=1 Tax=Molossus molossus TaxID=27622 RepID=A0A7J8JXS7_MOLMO|nr:hypothetical protein HJG59_007947 [Molossus molossus]
MALPMLTPSCPLEAWMEQDGRRETRGLALSTAPWRGAWSAGGPHWDSMPPAALQVSSVQTAPPSWEVTPHRCGSALRRTLADSGASPLRVPIQPGNIPPLLGMKPGNWPEGPVGGSVCGGSRASVPTQPIQTLGDFPGRALSWPSVVQGSLVETCAMSTLISYETWRSGSRG